jgi:hypothetical protein
MRVIGNTDPNWNERLWRYFKTARFIWTLENSRLYFAASTQFTDPFEGATAVLPPDFPVDPRYGEMEGVERAFFAVRPFKKINCWHRADYESDAMWKLYAAESKGVAVCTTPERMRAAIKPFRLRPDYGVEDLWAGPVSYYDLMNVRLRHHNNDLYFAKHAAFSWEKEFRLLISLVNALENGVDPPVSGIEVDVDLGALIERIVLGPKLVPDERNLIVEATRRLGLGDRLCKSSLLGQPRFI